MSLYDFVYNLQRKPRGAKKRILVILLAVSFIILCAFWVIIFKRQVSRTISQTKIGSEETVGGSGQDLIGPVSAIIKGIKDLKSGVSEKIGELKSESSSKNKKERPVYELPRN